MNDAAAGRAQTRPMFFATPSTKEHTMQRIAATVVLVAVVALTLASVASAYRGHRSHAPARASHLHHRAAY